MKVRCPGPGADEPSATRARLVAKGKKTAEHGLVMNVEPREPRYRVEDWTWEAKRGVRSTVKG